MATLSLGLQATTMNRILDIYGRNTMTRQESIEKLHDILPQEEAEDIMRLEKEADDMVGRGENLEIDPFTTWHNDDGHRRPHLTEQGARTVFQGPGSSSNTSRQPSRYAQDSRFRGAERGQGSPSWGYGSPRS